MITSKDILKKELSGLISSKEFIENLIERWHDHSRYNHLWAEIERFNDQHGKILDMACGVGTFFFHGLENGLTWITSKSIVKILQKHNNLQITDLSKLYKDRYIEKR